MKLAKQIASFVLSAAILISLPLSVLAEPIQLEEGMPIRLRMVETISSKSATEGDVVHLEVADDVMGPDGKTVLVKAGTTAKGSVANVEERGRLGKKGEISINLDSTKAVDGTRVPLRASKNSEGKERVGSTVALSLIVSPLFLLRKGKDATIPAGTNINAYVDTDLMVEVATTSTTSVSTPANRFNPASQQPQTGTNPQRP